MYQVSIFNNNTETVIHYPSADADDPHLNQIKLKEGLSTVDCLSFPIFSTNQGYNKLFDLTTKVKVIDTRDNTVRFSGRLLEASEKMETSGLIYKEVIIEGAMSFLNDTKQRDNTFVTYDVITFINQILSIHNSKVDVGRQIQVGNVDTTGSVAHTCEFKTTLAEILSVREDIGGDIRVRETNGVLYLDWLKTISANTVEIMLGVNMKDMIIKKDIASLGTRIIPLGANNLTISTVNGGIDYLDDSTSKNIYGVVEKTVEYKDITDPYTLMYTCLLDIKKYTQPIYVLTSNALDLSFLSGNKAEQFALGTSLHIVNPVMAVDDVYKAVQTDIDLLAPYNPTLTIANVPVTITNTINDLRNSSLQNDGVYNNVQIGKSFGIRVVRSDNNVVTTMNATEGISIQNASKKVFYVDINGNLVAQDITSNNMIAKGGTFDDIKANRGVFDDITVNRGTFNDITANRGTYDEITVTDGTFTNMNAEGGTFDSITAVNGFTVEDGDTSCSIGSRGITLTNGSYTSGMYVYQSKNVPAIMFDDHVQINQSMTVKHGVDIGGNLNVEGTIDVDGERLNTLIQRLARGVVVDMVRAEALE